jgi:hypothetical protein
MDPTGLLARLSPQALIEFLKQWDAQVTDLDKDWESERQALEVASLVSNRITQSRTFERDVI